MVYKSVSLESVIGKVLRDTRIPDTTYILDMQEWIPEAMGLLGTRAEMKKCYKDINICFFKGKLPCGLMELMAVEYSGHRLRYGLGVKHHATGAPSRMEDNTAFVTKMIAEETVNGNTVWTTTLESALLLPESNWLFYETELDTITTSFEEGTVRLHYKSIATDEHGFPLVPDNANYKEALYWYVRAKIAGTGWKDPVFGRDVITLMGLFEKHGDRAIGEITYPSPDQVEASLNASVRLIPDMNYFENFFHSPTPENKYL